MKAIVAIDKIWNIGINNELLFHIKEDMKFFKETTKNKIVLMGRKTLESLPNGDFLKDRYNLVLSNSRHEDHDNAFIGNLDAINEQLKKYNTDDVFVIGGESVYESFIDRCDTAYVTMLDKFMLADACMVNIAFRNFVMREIISEGTHNESDYIITRWEKSKTDAYNAVLMFYDIITNTMVFAYSYNLIDWLDIYTNEHIDLNNTIRKIKGLPDFINEDYIAISSIDDRYRSNITLVFKTLGDIKHIMTYFRLAVFTDDKSDAISKFNDTMENIFSY